MIKITDKSQCCGCTACASICPNDAILMKPDALGFLYPVVDSDKCTDCGLCEKVCAFHANYDTSNNLPVPEVYAARHKNMQEVETSRSGAAFIAISDWILDQDGVVYGVGYTDHFRVVHKRATTREERNEFKGSKYVQSDLDDIFRQVKQDLKDGIIVLFSGTPCQTAGLKSFISKTLQNNLFLVDIVCHGVPSPYIWRDYIEYLEKKYGDRIVKVNFRDKEEFGWSAHCESFEFTRRKKLSRTTFTYLFYKHIMFRTSCGSCPFANTQRTGDITLADFWGWEKTNPHLNEDDKGISLLFINTLKGKRIFEYIKQELYVYSVELENCMQPNMQHPSRLHSQRNLFETDYVQYGLGYILRRYGDAGWRYRIEKSMHKIETAKRLFLQKFVR